MAEPGFQKVQAATAAEVCARMVPDTDVDAPALPDQALAPAAYLGALMDGGLLPEAIRFLAAALPKREAVWWACTCARASLAPDARPEAAVALKAAEAWVYRPTEPNRRAAHEGAEAAGLESPSAWAAMAAFWSGGSIAAPGAPAVEPDEKLLPTAVSGAVLLAAVQREPERADERYRAFLAGGIDIANGGRGNPAASGAS